MFTAPWPPFSTLAISSFLQSPQSTKQTRVTSPTSLSSRMVSGRHAIRPSPLNYASVGNCPLAKTMEVNQKTYFELIGGLLIQHQHLFVTNIS